MARGIFDLHCGMLLLVFTQCSIPVPGHHITFSCHVSLGSSCLRQYQTYVVLMTLTGILCRMPLFWNLSDVLLMIRLGLWVLERIFGRTVNFGVLNLIISQIFE